MPQFDHEKLKVYQDAIAFTATTNDLLATIPKSAAVHNQLDKASTSIPLNIAEGNDKHTPKDRCHYFDIARGSALECAACLDVAKAKHFLNSDDIRPAKAALAEIVSMLVGLIRSNSPDRNI